MCKKMQGFKVCNSPIKTDKMKLKYIFMVFDLLLVFFTLFCYNRNYIQLHLPLHRYSFCEAVEQM